MIVYDRLRERIEDWGEMLRRDGWRSALPAVGREFLGLLYQRVRFAVVARSLVDPLPDLAPEIAVELRELTVADLPSVREIHRPSGARLCARRLARGDLGLLALHQGQPVGYAWGCVEIEPAAGWMGLRLEPGDMLCVDVYTAPACRNRGIQKALTLGRFRHFQRLGYRRALAYIDVHNTPSLTAWGKVGSRVVRYIDVIRIGTWRHVRHLAGDTRPDSVPLPVRG